jgi:hypothetical protein
VGCVVVIAEWVFVLDSQKEVLVSCLSEAGIEPGSFLWIRFKSTDNPFSFMLICASSPFEHACYSQKVTPNKAFPLNCSTKQSLSGRAKVIGTF